MRALLATPSELPTLAVLDTLEHVPDAALDVSRLLAATGR